MDTTPIYELRARLRAAAMAGTNLLSEDFRLRRAYEAFRPLEAASPVFAKAGQLTSRLLSPDCQNPQGALLDAITLVDAVICTLGAVDVAGEIAPFDTISTEETADSLVVNAPCSTLKELLEALTTSGGKHYGYVCDMHENHPELFRDYRVRYTLVQALGASYAELADKVEQWLTEEGDQTILPALYRDFDPKGRKEMVRRVRVISALSGAGANDFYVRMLREAQKDVRTELIDALRHEPQNVTLLFDLSKTEKGKNKDKVFELLAEIQDEKVNDFFRELAKKKPETVLKYLRNTTTDWSSELVADLCDQLLEKLDTVDAVSGEEKQAVSDRMRDAVRALFGKGGIRICECYRKLLSQKEKINRLLRETWRKPQDTYGRDTLQYGVLQSCKYWYKAEERELETALGKILHHSLIVTPDRNLQALALELYQNGNSRKTNVKFLPAAATVKLMDDGDCVKWLEEQAADKVLLVSKFSKERMKSVIEAAAYVKWDKKENSYALFGSYLDVCYPEFKSVGRPVRIPRAKEVVEWLQKHASKEVDEVLAYWIPLNDEDMCRVMGDYFYRRALIAEDSRGYMESMKECGWTICKGLGINIVKNNPSMSAWALYSRLTLLPGDKDAIMEEMRTVSHMIKNGELKVKKLNTEELKEYMNRWYMGR